MTILHAVILGIIEGLTEFLPISSTAHLIIGSELLHIPSSDFLKTFEISIQLGAILAVVVLYWKKIISSWNLLFKIGAAFIPTAILGLIFYRIIKTFLMDNLIVVASALLLGGIVLIVFEKFYSPKKEAEQELKSISYVQAIIIGLFQSLAMIPGVSRAAATIIGGLGLGIRRKTIVEFSFLLAIPTMLAATALDLYKTPLILSNQEILIWIIGFVLSFVTAIIGVKLLLRFIQKNNFIPFGWYRVILGAAILTWILF